MPSPFPGMDPYLEGREWMSFHVQYCTELARLLAPKLRPRYVALPMRRTVVDTPDDLAISTKPDSMYPDVSVLERSPVPLSVSSAGITVLEPTHQLATIMPEEVPQYSVEIRDVEDRQLVTLIELLSPANKRGEGYEEYVEKRTRILRSRTHLLEIDLLRNGNRVPMQEALPDSPYFVFLGRRKHRPMIDIWAVGLDQPLPAIPIPLLPEDEDVALDLQAAFTSVYDSLGYDLILDYSRPADIPLKGEAADWASQLLSN